MKEARIDSDGIKKDREKQRAVIKKGDRIDLTLDNLANGGDSVGHYHGLAVFVPGGVPGERVKVSIKEKKKNYARGQIEEIISSSEKRVIPECGVYNSCGGCQLQQMDYSEQLLHKKQIVSDALHRIGGLEGIEVNDSLAADFPWQYRNKAQFPLTLDREGMIKTGFYRKGSHQVVVNDNCLIQHPLINRIVSETLKVLNTYQLSVYDEQKHRGLLRHLLVRVGVCTNQALLTIITSSRNFPGGEDIAGEIMERVPELVGVLQNINPQRTNVILGKETRLIRGSGRYIDYIGDIKFEVSPVSFFQVNTLQTEKLYQLVSDYAALSGNELVVDCYCGIGSISLYLARQAGQVYGIEVVGPAVRDARRNAELNRIDNSQFIEGTVEEKLPELLEEGKQPDLLIFDPPRKGLDSSTIDTVLAVEPEKIIYVSCNPATLARDLKILTDKYRVEKVQPVDMFPQTYHVETVVLLEKE